jgi:hypothetical protein
VKEQVFFTARNFILQDITITFQSNDDEMPVCMSPNYTIVNIRAKSVVIIIPSNENMQVTAMLTELADSM